MRHHIRIRAGLSAAIAAGALALAGCAGGSGSGAAGAGGAEGLTPVQIDVLPSVATVPVYVGEERGIFEKHGIDLTIGTGQGGAAILAAVTAGQVQFGFGNVISLIQANEQGLGVQMIANGSLEGDPNDPPEHPQNLVVVGEDSKITDAADLSGATIAINSLGNASELTTRAAIDEAGGDSSTVRFAEMGMADSLPALEQGQVDAIFIVEPFSSTAIADGARPVLAPFTEPMPDDAASIANYFTSTALVESDPELVEAFSAALNESNVWAQEHPDQMREAVVTHMGMEPDVVDRMTFPYWTDKFNVDSIRALGDLGREYGFLKKDPDYETLLPACAQDGGCVL